VVIRSYRGEILPAPDRSKKGKEQEERLGVVYSDNQDYNYTKYLAKLNDHTRRGKHLISR
jgi:hypothetical protein